MTDPANPPPPLLAAFNVSQPDFVARTNLATVWQVRMTDGTSAALKLYHHEEMRNEAHGTRLLKSLNGEGVAYIYEQTDAAVLLEWLDGPSAGDLTRQGRDREAAEVLVAVANRIHRQTPQIDDAYPRLEDWFADLFDLAPGAKLTDRRRTDLDRSKRIARTLLRTQTDIRALHGDLHHDNIRKGARGFCAFDAKGVVGERTYELANAFRNPSGADRIVRDEARIRWLADYWSQAFGVGLGPLVQWAAVKCALSIAWRSEATVDDDPEFDLLSALLAVADSA